MSTWEPCRYPHCGHPRPIMTLPPLLPHVLVSAVTVQNCSINAAALPLGFPLFSFPFFLCPPRVILGSFYKEEKQRLCSFSVGEEKIFFMG